MGRGYLVVLVWLTVSLGSCSEFADSEAQRLCRSILPALYDPGTRFDVVDTERLARSDPAAPVLVVRYTVQAAPTAAARRPSLDQRIRALTCSFAATTGNAQPRLVALATDRTALGPARLYMIQKYWIDSGAVIGADPAPIAVARFAPTVPRPVAVGLQQVLSALPSIAIYALLAAAYSLVYGLVGRINLAFGDLASLAGYGAFLGFSMIGDSYPLLAVTLALLLGLLTAAIHGGVLGHAVLARLVQAPGQHVLIATIGISIAWQEAMRLTQGAGNRWLSPLINRPTGIAKADDFIVTVTPMALIVAGIAAAVACALVYAMRMSRFGLTWRASADDPVAAAMFGIDPRRTLVLTMLLAAALSGLCGVLTTLFYGGVGYAGGLVTGLKALIAAIAGGIGSIHGALIGGLLLGLAETIWSAVFPIEYREPAIFLGLAAMLWLRPGGLFGNAHAHEKIGPR
jgi:branched-chain amino acid transport system permease protein